MFDSPLTIFALAIAPIVTVIFVSVFFVKREPVSQPSIAAAIPLGLSSMALLLAQSGLVLLATFQQIAVQRASGIKAVVAGMLRAQQPLSWGFLDFAVCLAVLVLVSAVLRYSSEVETPLMRAYISVPALILTAVVVVALFLIVWLQYGTVDLVMMVCDKHRYQELASMYGTTNPADLAARISSRLAIIVFLSIALFVALIVSGVLNLVWRKKQNPRQAFATVLIVGALVGAGASALSEFGFVDYLQNLK